jgi:hypothetical protein
MITIIGFYFEVIFGFEFDFEVRLRFDLNQLLENSIND